MKDFSLTNLEEFDDHRCVIFLKDKVSGLSAFIAIHRGGLLKPAFGATRFWHYENEIDGLRDALRLSRLMSYKSALAGLPHGGAKAVIIDNGNIDAGTRRGILLAYAERLNYLHGNFITGTDMGLQQSDLEFMKEKTPYLVGFKIDPTTYTGLGLKYALQTCLQEVFGDSGAAGRSFAIEGAGKIGQEFLKIIHGHAAKIYLADIREDNLVHAKKLFPEVEILQTDELRKKEVDVYSPCGANGSINNESVDLFKCKLIIGGANNQLQNPEVGERLHQRGIIYAPDYVVNAGGLISVVHEFDSEIDLEKLNEKIKNIQNTLMAIFSESKKTTKPPFVVANLMAEKIIAGNF